MLCVKPCYLQCCASGGHGKLVHPDDEFEKQGEYALSDNYVKASDGHKLKASEDVYRIHDNIVASYVDPSKNHGEDGFMEIMIH